MTINIFDTTFNRVINYTFWEFPGGEIGVKVDIPNFSRSIKVTADGILDSKQLVILKQSICALKSAGCGDITLIMPYLPYARQDRLCNPGEDFALLTFCRSFFTDLPIKELIVYDLHSSVSHTLLGNYVEKFTEIRQVDLVRQSLQFYDCIVFPDAGAGKKYEQYKPYLNASQDVVVLDKFRKDGKVNYEPCTVDFTGKKVLVVDDICDGGVTFLSLAESMTHKPYRMDLFVTHGIFSKGIDSLLQSYDNVITVNLMTSDQQVRTNRKLIVTSL